MLDGYFSQLIPLMRELGGNVYQLIGDAVMVVFNKNGSQPDHARLAVRAALAFQVTAAEDAAANPRLATVSRRRQQRRGRVGHRR